MFPFSYITDFYICVDLYIIEFQKRGLPHCHTLIWVNVEYKIKTPEEVDAFITTELPDPLLDPQLYATICNYNNVHDPWSVWIAQ